jgi:carboxypeptidase Taq
MSQLDNWERGNLARMNHIYTHQSGFIEPGLIERYEQTLADAEQEWISNYNEDAPEEGFAAQIEPFSRAIAVIREAVAEPARRMGVKPSEAAQDLLNPGVSNDDVDKILAKIKPGYPELVAAITAQSNETEPPLALPEIPTEVQLRIFDRLKNEMLLAAGWNEDKLAQSGVNIAPLQTSATGFSWGSNKNITISIESYEDNLVKGLGNTRHETGHLLYLLHMSTLPEQAQDRPVGQFNGFGAHETAAMFMEQAGFRHTAIELSTPIIHEELARAQSEGLLPADFDVDDPALTPDNLYRLTNRPDLQNTDWCTSELVLPPNMAWRVLAMRKLIDEETITDPQTGAQRPFAVTDLPQFWADTMKDWTGIDHDPKAFQIGESHVFEGLGGYFWAYMTGAMSAATLHSQIAPQATAQDAKVNSLQDYVRLYTDTLKTRLFDHASKYSPLETLLRTLNGADPHDPAAFMARVSAAAQPGMPAPDEILATRRAAPVSAAPRIEAGNAAPL